MNKMDKTEDVTKILLKIIRLPAERQALIAGFVEGLGFNNPDSASGETSAEDKPNQTK